MRSLVTTIFCNFPLSGVEGASLAVWYPVLLDFGQGKCGLGYKFSVGCGLQGRWRSTSGCLFSV